jgi:hypothetical protein
MKQAAKVKKKIPLALVASRPRRECHESLAFDQDPHADVDAGDCKFAGKCTTASRGCFSRPTERISAVQD